MSRNARKLAAILAVDVVGFSRLMGIDEAGTLATLKDLRKSLANPKVKEFHGRIVKAMGDGLLIEFPSVVDAVDCAADMQNWMVDYNSARPADRRILFRMGVNLGDVIIDGGDIYGDGVNIAARLEAIAPPGGIAIPSRVREEIRGKTDLPFENAGARELKNIAAPIEVWTWLPVMEGSISSGRSTAEPSRSSGLQSAKPSIAVLPFDNMSADPEQEFFVDGLTEDIITELSRFPDLIVIARNSAFTYKGKPVRIQEVGRELGVRYVGEGSVRRAGNRVRVTIQLIEAETEKHIWAEKYDGDLDDIFELQDKITRAIVGVLPGRIESADSLRIARKPPEAMAAYDYLLRGKIHHHDLTPESNALALKELNKAIEIDPSFAQAYAWKACTLGQAVARRYTDDPDGVFQQAVEAVEQAVKLNPDDLECHRMMCELCMTHQQWDEAKQHHDLAFSMNPNDPRLVAQKGALLTWMGRPEEGRAWVEKAMRLDPFGVGGWSHIHGRALYCEHKYDEAAKAYKRIQKPRYQNFADLAASLAMAGQPEQAKAAVAKVLELEPGFSSRTYAQASLYYKKDAERAHHLEGLLKAGLPE